jgi:cell shape-determining protein MreC
MLAQAETLQEIGQQPAKFEARDRLEPSETTTPSLDCRFTESASNEAELVTARKEIEKLRSKVAGAETENAEVRDQLKAVGFENSLLIEKLGSLEARSNNRRVNNKSRERGSPGIRGKVLAVNQVYNFVVLNLGARQGVENNSDMLVVRDGNLIGKIRVSSVEPSSSIGDIIAASLARAAQVQRGDCVIYAGTD